MSLIEVESDLITFIKELARAAGNICIQERKTFGSKDLAFKTPKDLVTTADKKVEAFLIEAIKKTYPGHGIWGEETGEQQGSQAFRWIIDPIDGTTSFVHNQPFYSVSIALEKDGRLELGAVFAPALNQLFYAQAGHGAFLNGDSIRVSKAQNLSEAVMATGFACLRAGVQPNNLPRFNRIVPKLRDIRRYGSAAIDLCYVAAGRLDGFWEMYLNLYDVAAGALIVQEACGIVTDFSGGQDFPQNGIAAAPAGLHPQLIELLADNP